MEERELIKLRESARESAIKRIKKQLEKDKEFYKLKKLKDLIKNEAI